MIAVYERAVTLPRALQIALASRRARLGTAAIFLVLAVLYAMLLPATDTGGAIGLVSLRFLTPGALVLAVVMALLLALTLALGLHGFRHGAGAKPAGGVLGAVLAALPALLCCSPILPLTIAAVAAVLPAAGSLGVPLQGFIATHEAWIYGVAIALMAWGLYGSARRVLSCGVPRRTQPARPRAERVLRGRAYSALKERTMMQDNCCADNGKHAGTYDLAVVGAGSAGFSAAITAAELGARIALIGHGTIGGTCVNTGCVPSKTLIRAAETLHQAEAAARFAGIRAEGRIEDWRAVVRQKDALVSSLRQAKYVDLLPSYNTIAYLEGEARLTDGGVAVNGTLVKAGKVIIATGASPSPPPIPGIERVPYLTSTTALELERLPESLLIIGGGYIGCELGQMFARAGVAVTIAFRSRLLPEAEPEISQALSGYFRDDGIVVRGGVLYRDIRQGPGGVALSVLVGGAVETITAAQVLVATGRRPNTDGMGLAEAGVALRPNGGIMVDDRMRTTKPGVYAAGDVTGRDAFVYMAAYGARLAAANALDGDGRRYDATAMPSVVFTDPQAASVGLTEAEARRQDLPVKTALLPLDQVPRALAARDTRGLIKLVADAANGRLLGAHILAPEGADSLQTAALAIKGGLTVEQLAETIFPYLTTVEGLKLAAQSFTKDIARLSCCAG